MTIREVPIQTVYIENNKSSHFNPIFDSLKIYFLILRFVSSSLLTVLVDYMLFFICYMLSKNLFVSVLGARMGASVLNFTLNKTYVFKNRESLYMQVSKYYILLFSIMFVSFVMINVLHEYFMMPVLFAKLFSELSLFPINFKIQSDFIFKKKNGM
jgi:putative flippase GtrA